jgi:hypothetical protein
MFPAMHRASLRVSICPQLIVEINMASFCSVLSFTTSEPPISSTDHGGGKRRADDGITLRRDLDYKVRAVKLVQALRERNGNGEDLRGAG